MPYQFVWTSDQSANILPNMRRALSIGGGSIAEHQVDAAEQVLPERETPHVLLNALGEEFGPHGPGGRHMRRDDDVRQRPQRMTGGERLGVSDVEGGAADRPRTKRRHERA